MTETHDLELCSNFVSGGWTAWCSCEWESDPHHTTAEATAAWEMHCDAVFAEACDGVTTDA